METQVSNSDELDLPTPPETPAVKTGWENEDDNFSIAEKEEKPDTLNEGVNIIDNTPEENTIDNNIESSKMSVVDVIGHIATVSDVNREFQRLLQEDKMENPKEVAKVLSARGFFINYK